MSDTNNTINNSNSANYRRSATTSEVRETPTRPITNEPNATISIKSPTARGRLHEEEGESSLSASYGSEEGDDTTNMRKSGGGGHQEGTSGSDNAVVTASTSNNNTSSDSNDRTSGSGSGSGGDGAGAGCGDATNGVGAGTAGNNSSSDGGGADTADRKPSATHNNASSSVHHHHHHHHSHHYHHHHHSGGSASAAAAPASSSVPHQAAIVVAHLPAPSASDVSNNHSGSNHNSNSSGGEDCLVEPHKEPGFHKIKSTFKRLTRSLKKPKSSSSNNNNNSNNNGGAGTSPKSSSKSSARNKTQPEDGASGAKSSTKSSSARNKAEEASGPSSKDKASAAAAETAAATGDNSSGSSSEDNGGTNGSSSGSGTEGGYAASASSNDALRGNHHHGSRGGAAGEAEGGSYSSPSVSSSEDNLPPRHHKRQKTSSNTNGNGNNNNGNSAASNGNNGTGTRPLLSRKTESNLSVTSSDSIADFSSGATDSKVAKTMKALQESAWSNNEDDDDDDSAEESITSCSHAEESSDEGRRPPNNNGNSSGSHNKKHKGLQHHHHHRSGGGTKTKAEAVAEASRSLAAVARQHHNLQQHHHHHHHHHHHDRKRRAPGLLPRSLQVPNNNSNNNKSSSGAAVAASAAAAAAQPASCSSSSSRRNKKVHIADGVVSTVTKGRLKSCGTVVGGSNSGAAKPPVLTVGSDVMAHVLTFLEPPEILSVLTMPLSKDWTATFTRQPELWRVLCLLEPFKAQVEDDSSDEDDGNDSDGSPFYRHGSLYHDPFHTESELRTSFGKFRIMYTSFVRCMRYLARIKDDALNGRPPSVIDYGTGGDSTTNGHYNISSNQNLQSFLARARGVVAHQPQPPQVVEEGKESSDASAAAGAPPPAMAAAAAAARAAPIGVSDDGSSTEAPNPKIAKRRRAKEQEAAALGSSSNKKRKKSKFGVSKLTQRLLLPAAGGQVTAHAAELPWSCAIYSIVNWMVGFAEVEGIQTMCLKVLPFLLEDEQQRMTAQRAGLTDVVLRDMVMFPNSSQLHTAAFHTVVLLARPVGGREGMLFHTSMVNSSGIFNSSNGTASAGNNNNSTVNGNGTATNGKNGIAVMLDSMRRFQDDEILQAMSCWSLVNIALAPAQKDVLIKLGGIEVTTNAMVAHPFSAEVQFRALFALINLVIPCVGDGGGAAAVAADPSVAAAAAAEESSEREVLDEMVEQIVELVVLAMKNFCSSESILNRACLVLHNLSLTQDYHSALLWTPNCYQMLEWCLTNYRSDQVLQQSAAGTMHRLQLTLSNNEGLRVRFNAALASQQQISLEQAHREAVMIHEQQEQLHHNHLPT